MPALIRDGAAVELFPGLPFTDADGVQRPANWLELSLAEERAAAGVLDIVEPPAAPAGQVVHITGLGLEDGKPTRTFALVDATPAPPPVPESVHVYQFAGQAAAEGIVTVDEAKAWAGAGVVPAKLQAAVDRLVPDPEAHDRLTFFLVGATDFPRYSANTVALAAVFGKDTPEKVDAFFVAAGER